MHVCVCCFEMGSHVAQARGSTIYNQRWPYCSDPTGVIGVHQQFYVVLDMAFYMLGKHGWACKAEAGGP